MPRSNRLSYTGTKNNKLEGIKKLIFLTNNYSKIIIWSCQKNYLILIPSGLCFKIYLRVFKQKILGNHFWRALINHRTSHAISRASVTKPNIIESKKKMSPQNLPGRMPNNAKEARNKIRKVKRFFRTICIFPCILCGPDGVRETLLFELLLFFLGILYKGRGSF